MGLRRQKTIRILEILLLACATACLVCREAFGSWAFTLCSCTN